MIRKLDQNSISLSTQIEIIAIDTKDIDTRDIIRSEAFGKWVIDACGVKYYDAEAMRVAP